ncbi:hypothetical protein CWE27_27070 [Streptomyces sp. EAG2]|nr:hypothetical protein CWE27_27070 [Streptomyces sp. EAG2]
MPVEGGLKRRPGWKRWPQAPAGLQGCRPGYQSAGRAEGGGGVGRGGSGGVGAGAGARGGGGRGGGGGGGGVGCGTKEG